MIGSHIARYKVLISTLIFLGMMPEISLGQTDMLDVMDILEYLSDGDERALVNQAGDYLELALLEQPRRYTRSQALYVLQDFFRQYSPERFELDHSMTQGEEWWLIGHYTVRNEREPLRIYLRFGGSFPMYRLIAIQVIPT